MAAASRRFAEAHYLINITALLTYLAARHWFLHHPYNPKYTRLPAREVLFSQVIAGASSEAVAPPACSLRPPADYWPRVTERCGGRTAQERHVGLLLLSALAVKAVRRISLDALLADVLLYCKVGGWSHHQGCD